MPKTENKSKTFRPYSQKAGGGCDERRNCDMMNAEKGETAMSFERIGIRPAQILLPAPDVRKETWA